MFKSIVWSSTIDYPNQLATVLFVGDCNWCCEYCYNTNLRRMPSIDFDSQILPRLIQRKSFIDHIIISGGECTTYEQLPKIINELYKNGFTIGIHTNGTNLNMIKTITPYISFIGIDIKTFHGEYSAEHIIDTIKYIITTGIDYELRTTLYPPYTKNEDMIQICKLLKSLNIKEYVLQEYTNQLNNKLCSPYSKDEIQDILKLCNEYIPTVLKGEITYET